MHSYLANPRETRAVLERFGLSTKHRLGQNFLVSDAVIGRILRLAELCRDDVVYEVGPGIGTLTVALLSHAGAVVAVEADHTLVPVLADTCARDADRLALVSGDALRVTPETLCDALASLGGPAGVGPSPILSPVPTKLVANLPYQVAATVLLRTFERMLSVRSAVVMVQAEVADRITAVPGTKAYGAYTAKLALRAQVTGRFEVAPGNFMPPPHVNSAVVRLSRASVVDPVTGALLDDAAISAVARVIDAAFVQRRKTIRNSMAAAGLARPALDAAFAEAGIEPTARAETLASADFVRLAAALGARGGA